MLKKILRYAQYDVSLFRHSEPKGEESVYTIFNTPLRIIRS